MERIFVFGGISEVNTSTSFLPVSSSWVGWFNWLIVIMFRYAYHLVFIFVVYDIIHRHKAALSYSLLIKSGMWEKIEILFREISLALLIASATVIQVKIWCIDVTILILEQYVQTAATHAPHLYLRYFPFTLQLKAFMVANGIPVFRITINLVDLRCRLVIRLASIELELSSKIQSAVQHKTAIMNLIAIAKFFYIIYNAIFISLFGAGQTKRGLLVPISNYYFGNVEMNGRRILHLHCLVWLKGVSHLAMLRTQLQNNDKFRQKLLSFLEYIIKCSASQNPHL